MKVFDFHVPLLPIQTHIAVGRGCLDVDSIRKMGGRVALIADEAVKERAERLCSDLKGELFLFSGGEASKTRENKQRFEDELLKKSFGRDTLLIGMGGGVTTDLAAFLASTYMRGVPLVLIPTTLLAMVDAAIGGKTAVDTPFGKNLIGSFYHPKALFIDPSFLDTLPEREILNGLAEMLKYGLIREKRIWDLLASGSEIESLIEACVQCKLTVVKEDPKEKGLRRILNFGHTIGHAVEQVSNYRIAHGEAVAIGCVAEAYLSFELGYLNKETFDEIVDVYRKFGFPMKLPPLIETFWQALSLDKKGASKEARYVLIDSIGHCLDFDGAYCRTAPRKMIEDTMNWMNHGPLSHPPK